ncbi:MAG: hypothetical protein JO233_07520 [Candidatus Eremiobacteraeota bacterium]|nr:hypothetical protein [Candidatus Eremiobacteraeota bacterium]
MPAPQPQPCTGTPPPAPAGPPPTTPPGLQVPAGVRIQLIANVANARELAFLPTGDLLVGTLGNTISIVPSADAAGNAGAAQVFATLPDSPAAGVAFSANACAIYVGTQFGVYRINYKPGDLIASSSPQQIASVRTGGGGGHVTTTVAVSANTLYASVGSSCNSCSESDPTRATIQQMALDGSNRSARAIHIRNAIGLAVNPKTGVLWVGDAGQDDLPVGHPYELLDPVGTRAGVPDYGWPNCEENHQAYGSGASCANQTVPLVEFPAYQTIIGVAIVPANNSGAFALPPQYNGGAFVAMHGSWHQSGGIPVAPPRVSFVPLSGDVPASSVNWSDPTTQWHDMISGFQTPSGSRIGRPTGVAIGPQGDLFVADDLTGDIYRIRP